MPHGELLNALFHHHNCIVNNSKINFLLYYFFPFYAAFTADYCSFGCRVGNKTEFIESALLTEEEFQENPIINWDAISWVNRPTELWAVQLVLALVSLTEALLVAYLGYKVSVSWSIIENCSTWNEKDRIVVKFQGGLLRVEEIVLQKIFCSVFKLNGFHVLKKYILIGLQKI